MNYPEGSMRGSGIYSIDMTLTVTCPECEHEWDDDFATDDWGNVNDTILCPECNVDVQVSASVTNRWDD